MSANPIDDLVKQILNALPQGISDLRQDVEKNVRVAIEAGLQRLDLVTRKEFDVQREVLQRTREQLASLEQQVKQLEQRLKD